MFKSLLLVSFAAIVGFWSANILVAAKANDTSDYANHYRAYYQQPNSPPNAQTASSSTSSTNSGSISDVTTNWSGYVSSGGSNYSAVSGAWDIPSVSAGDQSLAADATWIGIGGVNSDDLIQIGTQNIVADGQVTGATFYEQLPDSSESISTVNASPGDSISASIKEIANGQWTVTIKDNTNGESYTNTVNYDSSESSAEWIEEAPSDTAGVIPLDDFGSVNFSGGYTTENGESLSISASGAKAINIDNQEAEALTSTSVVDDGSSFSISRTNVSSEEDATTTSSYDLGDFPGGGGWSRHEPGLRSRTDGYQQNSNF